MGRLTTSHIVETAIWLVVIVFFYYHSFAFDKDIEIYRYGASAWPRTILLLMALVALGQFAYYWKTGGEDSTSGLASIMEDDAEKDANKWGLGWYLSTFVLLSLPFI